MVSLIKCSYCQDGEHTKCMENYNPPSDDVYGGQICTCCDGLSDQEKRNKEKNEALDNLVEQAQELDLYDYPD